MSFARGGCRTQHGKGLKKALRPKKTAPPPKREWVSTISDLSVHKLTPAELDHRREIRKSHNKAAAQWEVREKALKARLRQAGCSPLDKASQTIIREVFSDKLLLQDVLARSDRALAVVNDLFGDSPRRQTGHPSVTVAPNLDSPFFQSSTGLSPLNDSMVDQQAVLEPDDDDNYYYSETRRLLQSKIQVKNKMGGPQRQRIRPGVSERRFASPQTPCAPAQTALNATAAVQRLRSRRNHSEEAVEDPSFLVSQVLNPDLSPRLPGSCRSARTRKRACKTPEPNGSSEASLGTEPSGLGLLQTMLAQVELDLDSLSPQTSTQSRQRSAQGFTGFSVALVSNLARLVQLLKNRENDAQTAIEEKQKLEEKLKEQRSLIDALTAETMILREETFSLKAELQQRTADLERKLDSVVSAMATHINQPRGSDVIAPVPQPVAERPPVSVSPAIRLSSPGQGDALQPVPETDQVAYKELRSPSSASSLVSLPLASLPLTLRLSPDALEAKIAKLCHLRDVIADAQSSVGGSPGNGGTAKQKRSASVGTGTVTPDRTSPGPESSAGLGQHVRQVTHQGTLNNNSVSDVQQRLLEVNRKSAAARGRLLDLIEQQKRTLSARVSPSVSPVPPSAFSPRTSGGSGSMDGSLLKPADDKRSAGSQAFSRHYEEAQRDGSTPTQKQQVQDSCFALSAHV
ncbi:spindle and centriole-associated protein 1 isoform X2 [Syngnathus typhle]|uniref:spindle and centriole-associated protein 1 isoform X2 n=1 Tax=Syngnathus typhle TaxID=161592 RepID=UPI002A6B1061|nr:spindle and centriole-associated protein 1 isoform X2 [Syngnathus typhle]